MARTDGDLDAACDAVFAVDAADRITDANARGEQLAGYPREELKGMQVARLLVDHGASAGPPAPSVVPGRVRYLSAKSGWRLRRKTGELVAIEGVVCPDRDGSAVVVRERGASKDVRVAAQVLLAMLDDLVAANATEAREIAVRARELCAFALVGAASTSALLVADDPDQAARLASELVALGLALEIVSSATSALAILETRGADLVVVTPRPAARMLPLLREAHPGVPVIVVGGKRVALAEVVEALDHVRR